MLIRYIKGTFSNQYTVTVGVEFSSKKVVVDNGPEVRLQIWDTVHILIEKAGQ
jgi:GTPase SAR1 family protein